MKKIYDVTIRFALDVPAGMAEPRDWRWDSILSMIVGAHDSGQAEVPLLKIEQKILDLDTWIKEKGPALWLPSPEAREHLRKVWEFAESIDRLDRLVRAMDQAVFPTFFGKPATTMLVRDDGRSFYFEIRPQSAAKPRGEGPFLMNGGVIFHEEYKDGKPSGTGDWSVHT